MSKKHIWVYDAMIGTPFVVFNAIRREQMKENRNRASVPVFLLYYDRDRIIIFI